MANSRLSDQLRAVETSRNQTLLEREMKFQEQIKKMEI